MFCSCMISTHKTASRGPSAIAELLVHRADGFICVSHTFYVSRKRWDMVAARCTAGLLSHIIRESSSLETNGSLRLRHRPGGTAIS